MKNLSSSRLVADNPDRLVVCTGSFIRVHVAVFAVRVDIGAPLHMFQRRQQHMILRRHHLLRKLLRRRRKHHCRLQMHRIGLRPLQVQRNHRSLRNALRLPLRRPILIQRNQELIVLETLQLALRGQAQFLRPAWQQQIQLVLEKCLGPLDE